MKTPRGFEVGPLRWPLCTPLAWFGRTIGVIVFALCATFARGQSSLYDASLEIGQGPGGAVNSILVQDDGRILIGMSTPEYGRPTNNMYLVRLLSNGQVDASFNLIPDGDVSRLLKQPDGKILIGGNFDHLGDAEQHRLSRLLTNGLVDTGFDIGDVFASYERVYSIGLQSDGRILAASGYRVVRFQTNGVTDASWTDTNVFSGGFVSAFLPRADGSILVGGTFQSVNGVARPGFALLDSTGHLDPSFDPKLEVRTSVFSLIWDDQGNILVGGRMLRQGVAGSRLLARLKPDLEWDDGFSTDEFREIGDLFYPLPTIGSVLLQPDGKLVVAGAFYEVGGFWRRHLVRLDSQGYVDPCFDPGVGVGGFDGVYTLAQQTDGHILVGGSFAGFDGRNAPRNLVRVLPESDCNSTRVHLNWYNTNVFFVAGTCAPGGTNLLQFSTNLVDWDTLSMATTPYVYADNLGWPALASPVSFFRVKKEF